MSEGRLDVHPASTLSESRNKLNPDCIDCYCSGEAYYIIPVLMKAISLAMDIRTQQLEPKRIVHAIHHVANESAPVPGIGVVVIRQNLSLYVYPFDGPKIYIGDLPSPYEFFRIRTRFPVFTDESGIPVLTSHFLTTPICKYDCFFCSESGSVSSTSLVMSGTMKATMRQVIRAISVGAQAGFFDDSILFSGNVGRIHKFCKQMIELRTKPSQVTELLSNHSTTCDADYLQRIANFQWGAQFTIDMFLPCYSESEIKSVLSDMKEAGCSYIYIGVESLSEEVVAEIDKCQGRGDHGSWVDRVRIALELIHEADIRAGVSVIFGLPGETKETIEETIVNVEKLIKDGLIFIASPNILTYHPATPLGMQQSCDYNSPDIEIEPPYLYFDEAFPGAISTILDEEDLWSIHHQTMKRWGKARVKNTMRRIEIPNLPEIENDFEKIHDLNLFVYGEETNVQKVVPIILAFGDVEISYVAEVVEEIKHTIEEQIIQIPDNLYQRTQHWYVSSRDGGDNTFLYNATVRLDDGTGFKGGNIPCTVAAPVGGMAKIPIGLVHILYGSCKRQ